MEIHAGLIQRKSAIKNSTNISNKEEPTINSEQLTLMEEVLLLELINNNGSWSFWNETMSFVLRGSILIELAFRDRIELQKLATSQNILNRKIVIKNFVLTDIPLLDEVLKYIKQNGDSLKTVQTWIELLNGDIFSLRTKCRLHNLRERIAKDLTEKGILTIKKTNYLLFEVITFPVANNEVKCSLIQKVYDFLIKSWSTNFKNVDKRTLALILMAYAGNVIYEIIENFKGGAFEVADNRLQKLLDYFHENTYDDVTDVVLAVFSATV